MMSNALALASRGQKIGVVDNDPQQTASRWLEANPENIELTSMKADHSRFDFVFIDTP